MVKTLLSWGLLILLLEVVGVVVAAMAFSHIGVWAVEAWLAVVLIGKSFELDLKHQPRKQ